MPMTNSTKTIQSCNFFLKNISKIRRVLDIDTTKMLVCSLIFSRLDYCNSLLVGLPSNVTDLLQKVQNKAARIITLSKGRDHITPVLKQLHWLPISKRIEYKVLCYIYRCLEESAPVYLQELISKYEPSRSLRSSNALLLKMPTKVSQFSNKSFQCSGPRLWNNLSLKTKSSKSLGTFKKHLKTELFNQYYG